MFNDHPPDAIWFTSALQSSTAPQANITLSRHQAKNTVSHIKFMKVPLWLVQAQKARRHPIQTNKQPAVGTSRPYTSLMLSATSHMQLAAVGTLLYLLNCNWATVTQPRCFGSCRFLHDA